MRSLLGTTALGAIAAVTVAIPASAETVISTAVTTPQSTSASGDIKISSTGSVKPTSGAAVTLNTNNYVRNEGTIQVTGANDSTGILGNANVTGEITNSGTITLDENYTATDTDNDGDLDGPFAQGSNRFGIRVLGPGTFTGNVSHNGGAITVEGNNSGGLVVDSTLAGNLNVSGNVRVLGNDSVGVKAGDVTGNVIFRTGTIEVQGGNSVGVSLTGDIGGALVFQNSIQNTGYRYVQAPADTSKLDADDLLQGGSAVVVAGNVGGGILFDAKPANANPDDTDEDDDGIPDANETTATILTVGSAPAVQIGSATEATNIGAVAGSGGRGIVVKGSITGNGLYEGVAANGLVIGGLGNAVNVAGGMTVSGSIAAGANEGTATALRIGAGGNVPTVEVSGLVTATGAGTATTAARGIVIDAGATVNTIKNTGIIRAVRSGDEGTATAILDSSGTVSLIENSGTLGVIGAASLGDKATAFDLTANSIGTTVRQLAVTTGNAPSIIGQMLFGSGNDTLDVADGGVVGAAKFGAGNNALSLSGDAVMNGAVTFGGGSDTVQLAGTSSLFGNVDFGGGSDTLALTGTSSLTGQLLNSGGLAVNLGAGTRLNTTNLGTVNLASLTTGANAALGVAIDSASDTSTLFDVAGAANFGTGTTLDITLLSLADVAGTYKVLEAGTLTGGGNLVTSVGSIPFIFDGTIDTSTPNEVSVSIRQKTADELGINASEGSILSAVLNAADADDLIAGVFLGVEDSEGLQAALQQMLPDHAGGAFETATRGTRLTNRVFTDAKAPLVRRGTLGFWMQQVAWGGSKAIGSSSSYKLSGWGASGGVETALGPLGSVGLSLGYLAGKDGKGIGDNELTSSQYEGGAYWRTAVGPIRAFARATVGMLDFEGSRFFSTTVNGSLLSREANGKWKGRIFSGAAGATYDARVGALSIRPTVGIEYFSLREKGYTETGGGEAFDLTVDSRKSSETAASATVALGYDIIRADTIDDAFLRVELEAGRRQILDTELGETTARFGEGAPFTLESEKRTSGWIGGGRVIGGGAGLALTGELSTEEQQSEMSLGGRLGLQFTF
jgi:hypothetical protein